MTLRNQSETEVIHTLRKLKNCEVIIYKKSIYRLSSGKQFEREIGNIATKNNIRVIFGLEEE